MNSLSDKMALQMCFGITKTSNPQMRAKQQLVIKFYRIRVGKNGMGLGGISIWQLLVILLFFVLFIFPMLHVVFSKRSHGGAKIGWFIAVFIFSWLAYIVFLIVTQKELNAIRKRGGNA